MYIYLIYLFNASCLDVTKMPPPPKKKEIEIRCAINALMLKMKTIYTCM